MITVGMKAVVEPEDENVGCSRTMNTNHQKLLDATGRQLLRELQENARISFSEVARRVGLSIPAVTERVRKMEDAGIITGYRAEVDRTAVGLPMMAFIRINAPGGRWRQISRLAKESAEVLECYRVTGGESFIMKVVVSSTEHLETLIDRLTPFGQPITSIVLSAAVARRPLEPITGSGPSG